MNQNGAINMASFSKMKSIVYVLLGSCLVVAGAWLDVRFIERGFSAKEKPPALEAFLAKRVRRLATPSKSIRLKNPLLQGPNNIGAARDYFAVNCATCHGNNGDGKTLINSGLYPPAPDLRGKQTQNLTDGELFFIIRNGIRFTGMPAWEGDDDDIWQLVLFIRQVSTLSPKDIVQMNEINHLGPSTQ